VATVKEIPPNLPKHLPGRKYDRQFFFAITLLLVVVVAIGFGPTYYLAGVFRAPLPSRIVHIHGAVFSTWMILLVVQTGLISTRRVEWHRKLGVAGFVLACGMVLTVLLTAADFAMRAKAKPNSEALLTLLVVPFTDAAAFAVLAGLAYALRKNAVCTQATDYHCHCRTDQGGAGSLARSDSVSTSARSLYCDIRLSSFTGHIRSVVYAQDSSRYDLGQRVSYSYGTDRRLHRSNCTLACLRTLGSEFGRVTSVLDGIPA